MTRILAGLSGVRVPVGLIDFSPLRNVQTASGSPRVLPQSVKPTGREVPTHLHVVTTLGMSGVIPVRLNDVEKNFLVLQGHETNYC